MRLFEQYRPRTWAELIGQEKAVAKIDVLRRRGLAGRCLWLAGPSGVGKTTLAYLIAHEIADDMSITEMSADELTPSYLDRLKETMRLYGGLWGSKRTGKVYVVNESHGLTAGCVRRLLDMLEHGLPAHVTWIFTTTTDGLRLFEDRSIDASPLLSRCTEIRLTSQGMAPKFAARAREIAMAEGLDGKPESAYLALARDCGNNMRRMLSKIEDGEMLA